MKAKSLHIISLVLCVAMLASCGSSKKNVEQTSGIPSVSTTFNAESHLSKVQSVNPSSDALTTKVKVTLGSGEKSLSTSGTLKMKRNEVIFVSLVDPILGIAEVGRLEFTPNRVLIIDRMNKQYIDVPYSNVSFLKATNIDFSSLQALFWNEVFEPGKKQVKASDFQITPQAQDINMQLEGGVLTYDFLTSATSGQLKKTSVTGTANKSYKLDVDYSGFADFSGGKFPKALSLAFTNGTQKVSLAFELGTLKSSTDWKERTTVSSRYRKADAEKILKTLVK